jgi:KaiC/GvpD/RAD55 family RecA-like ATPase
MALHGGPGSGKTTLALALGRHLAPFGIQTLFLTAEEQQADLRVRADGLVADELRRLSFLPEKSEEWLTIERYEFQEGVDLLSSLYSSIEKLSKDLNSSPSQSLAIGAPKPCKAVIVLDGLHDLILLGSGSVAENPTSGLREFIDHCRKLRALVILTTAEDWIADTALDYLVDMAVRLSQDATDDYGKKPDRRLMISKSRYQLCAIGTHGFQIAGTRGVRFSPQINYQLDRKAIWKTRLPSESAFKEAMRQVMPFEAGLEFASGTTKKTTLRFVRQEATVDLPLGSNIFINGKGSGGKAALALKIAMSPALDKNRLPLPIRREKILIVSFLYPEEYYDNIVDRLVELRKAEYPSGGTDRRPFCKTLHLYPGSLRPNDLFNRIEWELDAAELHGEPFNTVIIDGLHNVFLQFPEIEEYKLFWPQIYAALRCRPVTIITTHTTFVLQDDDGQIMLTHSVSAGLDYAAVGPEHSYLRDLKRIEYSYATDKEALEAFQFCSKVEGIIPALESAHAVAFVMKHAKSHRKSDIVIINLSGRGDKDVMQVMEVLDA